MKTDTILVILVGLFFIFGLNIYTSNVGGQGFVQTLNSLSTFILIMITTVVCYLVATKKRFYTTNLLLPLAGLMISCCAVSFFNDSKLWDSTLSTLCIALLISGIFVVINLNEASKKQLIWVLLISCLIQTLVGIFQHHYPELSLNILKYNPDYGRPYGIFAQVNLFASFISTGLAISWYLLLGGSNSKRTAAVLIISILIITYGIYLTNSRTGELSLLLISIVSLFYILANKLSKKSRIIYCVVGLISLSSLFVNNSVAHNDKKVSLIQHPSELPVNAVKTVPQLDSSNNFMGRSIGARIFIYENTMKMIFQKPLLGYGFGNFESSQIKYLADLYNTGKSENPGWVGLKHPHNIVLMLWVEGGIIPFLMLVVLVFYIVMMLLKQKTHGLLSLALITPISLHLMTELPFTASVPHIVLFGILLGILASSDKREVIGNYNRYIPCFFVGFSILSTTLLIPYAMLYMKSYINLMNYERRLPEEVKKNASFLLYINEVEGPIGYKFELFRKEVEFNAALNEKNKRKIREYLKWAEPNVNRDLSPVIFRTVIMSYLILGDKARALEYYNALAYYYPKVGRWETFETFLQTPTPKPLS